MEVRCNICGKRYDIGKDDKNFERMEQKPDSVYICDSCNKMLSLQAGHNNELLKKKA